MALLWEMADSNLDPRTRHILLFMVEQAIWGLSILARYTPTHFSQVNQYLSGVYYVASQHAECSPWYILDGKLDRLGKAFLKLKVDSGGAAVTTGTAARMPLSDDSIDYIFTDPPFGENIYYSDLNFLVESWHGVKTDPAPEAIVDRVRQKGIPEYQHLMYSCFAEYYRVLKPGRWMTVVFSNSKAAVWNAIQVALQQTGFVVAEVTALDKQQGSFQQVMSPNTVKQDLVISAYKPNGGLEDRFTKSGATVDSAWDFVQTHLQQLSVTKGKNGELEFIIERDPRRIYDRMVAWFVRHDAPVPLSNSEFQISIRSRFPERDGMIFLPAQVTEYDKKRAQTAQAPQMELFVSDERSAIDWVADFLKTRPSTYQDIHPEFIKQLGAGWKKHEARPELSALLEGNFLRYDGAGEVPSQIHRYLSTNYHDLRGLEKTDANDLPWDIVHSARPAVRLNLAELFPKLSYGAVRQVEAERLGILFDAHQTELQSARGESESRDFILEHVYQLTPRSIRTPVDFWRETLRLHFGGRALPEIFAEHVATVLHARGLLVGHPISQWLSSRSALLSGHCRHGHRRIASELQTSLRWRSQRLCSGWRSGSRARGRVGRGTGRPLREGLRIEWCWVSFES